MKKLYLAIFLPIYFVCFSQSDFDESQHTIYTYLYSREIDKARAVIDSEFLDSTDDSKKVIGYVYLADCYDAADNSQKQLKSLEKAKEIAGKTNRDTDYAYVDFGFAKYYRTHNRNELFIKHLKKSIRVFDEKSDENFILALLYEQESVYTEDNRVEKLDSISHIKSNEYALKSKVPVLINWTYNNLGNYYVNKFILTKSKKDFERIIDYYGKSYQYIEQIKNSNARNKALYVYYNNLSFTYSRTGDYPKALDYGQKALKMCENNKYLEDYSIHTFYNIGYIYEQQKQYPLSKEYYLKVYNRLPNKEYSVSDRIELLENLTNVCEKLHQYDEALRYSKETHQLAKNYYQKQFDDNIKSVEFYYKAEQQNRQIKYLEEKNEIYSRQRLLYISIAVLGFAGAVFLFFLLRFRQKLNRQKTNLLEIEKNETQLILQLEKEEKSRLKAEQELLTFQQEQIQKEALAASIRLNHKNAFIKEIRDGIKEKKQDSDLKRILKNEQFTDNEMNEMQNIIQKVHPVFFKRLNDAAKAKLTNQDMKYAAYIYLNMDNLQISRIIKVDPNTVRVTKYRLKQKLGLDKNQDLTDFIRNLDS